MAVWEGLRDEDKSPMNSLLRASMEFRASLVMRDAMDISMLSFTM